MARVQWLGAVGDKPTVLIGDSLAVGLAVPLKEALAPEPFQAFAKTGTTVAQWLASADLATALALTPKRVLVSLGSNDTKGKVPAATLKAQVNELAVKIRGSGAEVVWLMPGKLPWEYPELIAAVIAANARTIDQPTVAKDDGIHPTGDGYKTWAASIKEQLNPPTIATGAKQSIAPLLLIAAIVGVAWWVT